VRRRSSGEEVVALRQQAGIRSDHCRHQVYSGGSEESVDDTRGG
jgi:hypothetical protein